MDETIINLAIYLTATFTAALVTGVAGFAFGLVAAAVWLHILTPMKTATLIIAFGLVVQGISFWKLRHALRWRRLWPFFFGPALGVPLGVAILGCARHERAVAGNQRSDIDGYGLVLCRRPSGIAGRDVAGTKALWASRRSRLSQGGARPVAGLGNCAGRTPARTAFWLMATAVARPAP